MQLCYSQIKEYYYLVILSTNFFIGGPRTSAAIIAIGKLTDLALKNLLIYSLSIFSIFQNYMTAREILMKKISS